HFITWVSEKGCFCGRSSSRSVKMTRNEGAKVTSGMIRRTPHSPTRMCNRSCERSSGQVSAKRRTSRNNERLNLRAELADHGRQQVRPVALGHGQILGQLRERVPGQRVLEVELRPQRPLLFGRDANAELMHGHRPPLCVPGVGGVKLS